MIEIIDNIDNKNNHLAKFKQLLSDTFEVIMASPFLMEDFSPLFSNIDLSSLKSIHLITTLPPNTIDQIGKVNALSSFHELSQNNKTDISLRISLNNKLHGKVYIFKLTNGSYTALLSSANLTNKGLSRNHEWGVLLSDEDKEISKIEKNLLSTIEKDISMNDLFLFQKVISKYISKHDIKPENVDLNLFGMIPPKLLSNLLISEVGNYWLKPVGTSKEPIEKSRVFDKNVDKMYFSKRGRPDDVKIGDILIVYAAGRRKILSIYQVNSFPKKITNEEMKKEPWTERWPWYFEVINLTPSFGKKWNSYSLFLKTVKKEFLSQYPEEAFTANGSKTLGALSYGHDRLMLNPTFAKFIISIVENMQNKNT